MDIKKLSFGSFAFLFFISNFVHAQTCDPINTYCQSNSSQVCELTKDIIEKVGSYACIVIPDPTLLKPWNTKTECATRYTDKITKGTSTCTTVVGLSCPTVTGNPTLSCDTAMKVVSSCMTGNASACTQAHNDVAIATIFGPTCATYSIYQNGVLENSYETRIYNLVDDTLDAEISYVFGTLLGDVNFGNYVRGTVAYYKTSDAALNATLTPKSGARAKTIPGKIFFNIMNPPKDLIMHELTHIWQYRNRGVQGLTSDGCNDFFKSPGSIGDPDAQYKFTLESGKKFGAYGVEQQAQIVQTYYSYKYGVMAGCPSGGLFQNCASYSNDVDRIFALKNTISGVSGSTSSAASSIPSSILMSGTCVSQGCETPSRICGTQYHGVFKVVGTNYYCYAP